VRLRAGPAAKESMMSKRTAYKRLLGNIGPERSTKGARPDARLRDILGPLPRRTGKHRPSWKRILQDTISAHNDRHASKPKSVSFKTQTERACSLFRCFKDLHALGYKIRNPYCLGGRHIRALMDDWTSPRPRARDATLSPAMIQSELSHLRTFAFWIGKPGLVLPAEGYVADPALVRRHQAASRDQSWRGNDIDADRLIEQIAAHDPWVGAELRFARAFGLRVKEAVMLRPRLAELPAGHAIPRSSWPGSHLEVLRGTKGGRLRHIPIDTPAKRAALDAAKALVAEESHYLADPKRTLIQNLNRLRNVMKKFGVTQEALGVTPHGLRHEYAGDRYEVVAGVSPPVRGGALPDPATDQGARLHVVRELGHSRPQIASAYLGQSAVMRSKVRKPSDPPMK
jgi:integrase